MNVMQPRRDDTDGRYRVFCRVVPVSEVGPLMHLIRERIGVNHCEACAANRVFGTIPTITESNFFLRSIKCRQQWWRRRKGAQSVWTG